MKSSQVAIKRTVDLVVSTVALILSAPLLLFIGMAIIADSGGPIFYRGFRVGLRGRPFRMWKFRTMIVDADKVGGPSTADTDSRLTRAGSVLRKRKLDELPQLFNVLSGDMSLVGPRPEVQQYVDMYSCEERKILNVRPGITDFATLWNCDEGATLARSTDPERTYVDEIRPTKLRLQLEYVRRQSLAVDLRILAATVIAVVCRRRPSLEYLGTAYTRD